MKKGLTMRMRHILEGYAFVTPWVIGFALFMAYPLYQSLIYSFQDLKIAEGGFLSTWVGFKHYQFAFTTDTSFVPNMIGVISNLIVNVPLILIFAMFVALLLNRNMIGRIFFRGVFFLPVIMASGAVMAKLMEQRANRLPIFDNFTVISTLRSLLPRELLEPILMWADKLTLVMWGSGVQILIFIAGLQTISPTLYEAAKCDGATKWESFWKITFPMIIPMILVNTLFSIVASFTDANNKMMTYITDAFKTKNDYAYSSAMGWIYFVLIFIVIGFVFLIFRKSLSTADGRK